MSLGHPVADFGHPNIHIFLCIMQWDEKELDTQFTPNVYFWTPNSKILAKAVLCEVDKALAAENERVILPPWIHF